MATVTDELLDLHDLHDRIMIKLFSAAKNKHQQEFQKQGKAFNDKVRLYSKVGRALVEAKESGIDPYTAIEAALPWNEFTQSVTEAAQLAQPQTFDHLHLIGSTTARCAGISIPTATNICLSACCITSQTCGSRNITPIPPGSPTTCLC